MMKRSTLVGVFLVMIVISLNITGFQCSSSDMTTAKLALQPSTLNLNKADTSLTREIEKNPENCEALILLGEVKIRLSDYTKALSSFNKVISLAQCKEFQPKAEYDKKVAWGQLVGEGVGLFNASITASADSAKMDRQKAIEKYKLAILFNPDSVLTYQNLAIAEHTLGNTDEEIANYKKAWEIKKDPAFQTAIINAYIQKAEEAKKSGNTAGANENFAAAIASVTAARVSDPANPDLLGTLINLYIESGKASDAMPLMKEAVGKDPKNKVYQNDLGLLLMQGDNLPEAITHFDAAIATDSSYDQALQNGAVAYMKLGAKMKDDAAAKAAASKSKGSAIDKSYVEQFKKAIVLLEKLQTVKKDDANVLDALATAYGNAGMFKKAEETVKRADAVRKK
jgi:tetratricopeptide (TPR) repeat protein